MTEQKNEGFHYVYFIETHEITQNIKLSLSEKYSESNTIEKVDQTNNNNLENSYSVNIYRFKLCPEKIKNPEKLEIEVILEDGNKNKFTNKIKHLDINHDNFLYDFKISYEGNMMTMDIIMPEEELILSDSDIFTLYIKYLRKNKLTKDSKENNDLIYSSLKLLLNKKEKIYDFSFIILVFMESFKSPYFGDMLEIFKPKNIKGYGEISEEKAIKIIDNLGKVENKKFSNIGEKNKEEKLLNFYTLLLYLSFKFNKGSLNEILQNESIKIYVYKTLLINENIFKGLILTKQQILDLINISSFTSNFKQLINKLKYNNNLLVILQIINENKDLLLKKYIENNNKDEFIDLEVLIIPKKEDDINAIYNLLKDLLSFEKKNKKQYFMKISSNVIEKYIILFDQIDLDKLILLSKLISLLKKEEPKFDFKKNIEEIIHKNGIYFSLFKKLKNMDILNFIENDIYYKDKLYNNQKYRSVDILSGIDASLINEEFIKKWKKLKMFTIFQNQKEIFLNKVTSLIKDMKDFNILFKLLNQSDKEDKGKKEYDNLTISKMQAAFEVLIPTYSPEKCPNFEDEIIDLIYYSDLKKVNLKNFNKEYIQVLLNIDTVCNIYISLAKKYNNLSNNLKEIIIDFYLRNPLNNNILNLINVIKNSKELRKSLLNNMGEFIITENDLFEKEDSNNFKLLEGLMKEGIFKINEDDLQSTDYISKSTTMINNIVNNIKKFNINYSAVNYIFENNMKEIFKKRLSIILFNNEAEVLKYVEQLEKYNSDIKNTIEEFEKILNDFNFFSEISHKKEIIEINDVIHKIKNDKISKYINEYSNIYSQYKDKYSNEIKEREILLKSIFFRTIFKKNKIKNDDEKKCFIETNQKIKKLKRIFESGFMSSLKDFFNLGEKESNEKLIETCLKTFKRKNLDEELDKEIDILAKIIGINNKYDKNKIINNLAILFQKEEVLNVSNSLKIFIEKTRAIQTDFYKMINTIISNIYKKRDIYIIKQSMDELEHYGILSFENNINNSYIEILKKFREQPDSIDFLLNTTIEDCRNLQDFNRDNDDEFLTPNDILDFEKCIEFMRKLGTKKDMKNITDKDLLIKFQDLVLDNDNNKIELLFEKYINNYGELKELMTRGFANTEISRKKISDLHENSEFILKNIKGEFFVCKYYEKSKLNKNQLEHKKISIEKLLELRDKAQLAKSISGDDKEKIIAKENQEFIEMISQINSIYEIIKEIFNKGYPEEIVVQIKIIMGKAKFKFRGKECNSYKELILESKKILDELKEAQINAYKSKSLIRYIYGHQFNLFYNVMKNNNNKDEIFPILQYFTNNLITKTIDNFNYIENDNTLEDLMTNCENYLKKILEINNLKLEDICKESLIKKATNYVEYKGLYLFLCDKLEKDLFQIYKYLTSYIPLAQNVLLCNEKTSNEEIISFLYRAILCEYNSCFMVGGIESLNSNQKATMLELLNNLDDRYESMNSCLIFLCNNKNSDIFKSLNIIKHRKRLHLEKKDFENQKYEDDNAEIIHSDKCGVGKSHGIKYDILGRNKVYIHFPFGGVITPEDTIERLKKLKLDKFSEIHLDLYDTENIQLMMEFLFSLLITKYYKYNEDIFYLSKINKIKIEIPNGFIDFFAKFPILTLFSQKKYSINNLEPLMIQNDIKSNEQVVANYLKYLNKIDTIDLFFYLITPDLNNPNNSKKMNKIKKKYPNYEIVNAEIIPDKECNEIILKAIKTSNNIECPTYYQIKTFINILGTQLKLFSQNYFLSAFNILSLEDKDLFSIRSSIVNNFINITKYFIQSAFDDLLKSQTITRETLFGQYDEGEDIKKAFDDLAKKENGVFSFEKIDSSLIFFHEGDKGSFSILTNKNVEDKEYKNLLKLYNYYKKEKKKSLPNYKEYKQKDFLIELKEILNLDNPIGKSDKSKDDNKKSLEEITQNYVFTSDNFAKMIFILMRIRANVPVIMMGETGCGKTALIRKLSELMNNGDVNKMKILNIHAGTTEQEIIDFLIKNVIPASTELSIEETEKKINKFEEGRIYFEKKIWVFLDEINTCKSMGLIYELMCKNTYQGNLLPSNIIFIGACNPYRRAEMTKEEAIGLDVNNAFRDKNYLNDKEKEKITKNSLNSKNKLVYTVNPLPHSLLNYVFDFGNLNSENELKYIENMIQEPFDKIYEKNKNLKNDVLKNIKELTKNMIITSQDFIRKNNDISSVSLREIRRFNIFFEFFYNYLAYKKNNSEILMESLELEKEYSVYKSLSEIELLISSINLSIYICYYLRITNKNLRDKLVKLLNDYLSSYPDKFNNFLYIPNLEQKFIIKNINLEKGISKNRALLENIFSLFVTINNKVPIFIVGKPGCSKSLSVQLITKAMKGNSSTNLLFKSLPKIIVNSFQGSMGNTSQGVEGIFKKARDILKTLKEKKSKDIDNIISMIFFDEMGLAEYSPNNPLKVIHSELEYDLNEGDNKIAFVGISNWKLDASKMNRGIFISIPEPDEEDTKKTAFVICKSYNEILAEKNRKFFENLGKIYYNYKQYLKENHKLDGKEDFHGNRDFYHLVKNCAQNMVLKYNKNQDIFGKDLIDLGLISIERNFAGIQFDENGTLTSVEKVKQFLNNTIPLFQIKKEYDVIGRVKDNINDLNSRYLLLESKSSVSTYLLSSLLSEMNKEYLFFIGSKFEEDLQSEEYILKVLNKVQNYMEKGIVLIMEDLDSVYPALYDLFNQNFTVVSNNKYARLAIGSASNTFSLVNNNFRCIINVNVNEMDKQEAPFLNRFEKQIITFDYLLNEDLINESNNIMNILKDIVKTKTIHKGINYSLEKLLINCDIEEIRGIIYDCNKRGITKEKMFDEILSKISLTLPQDILLYLKFNGFNQKYKKEYKKILEYYEKGEHINLSRFIQTTNNNKNVVYTFSNDLDIITNIDNIDSPIVGNINKNNTKIIKLSSINSEIELERLIDEFIGIVDNKLCIIQFTPEKGNMMNYMKYFIGNKEKEYLNQNKEIKEYKKLFIFIMHIKRIFNSELNDFDKKSEKEKKEIEKKMLKETISNLSDYYQIFIDNINGDEQLTLNNILKMKGNDIFKKCLFLEDELSKNIFTTIFYMKYNINFPFGGLNKETYIDRIIHFIDSNKSLRLIINDVIMRQLTVQDNIISKIFNNPNYITENDIDIICIIKNYLSFLYTKILNLFYFKAEKDHFFSALLSFAEIEDLNKTKINNDSDNLISIICPEIFGPKFKKDKSNEEMNKIIKNIIQKVTEIYLNNLLFNDGKIRVTEKPGANNIDVILGLNLPGLKTTLDKIIKKVNDEICPKYYQNEVNYRGNKKKEKELENDKKLYDDELDKCNNSTLVEIEKEELLNLIEKSFVDNQNNIDLFYSILLNDYYTLYINNYILKSNNNNNNINNNNRNQNNQEENANENREENKNENIEEKNEKFEDIKKFLKLLVNLKNKYSKDENLNQIQILANNINWLESYVIEITMLLKMFSKLNNITEDLYTEISNIINYKLINYETSEVSLELISNKVFFMGMESLLRVIPRKIYKNFENAEDNKITLFQNTNKEILQDAMNLNTTLNLNSKEVYSLQEIIELIDAFNMNNINNITNIINFYNSQSIHLLNKKKNELCINLSKFYDYIFKTIGKDINFHKIMNKILFNEFLKIPNEDYRMQILKIILNDNKYILNSTQILKSYLKNYIINNPEEDLKENIQILSNEKNPLISLLNSIKNPYLEEILLNIFDGEIIHYFESIPLTKDKKNLKKSSKKVVTDSKNASVYILNESFNIFKNLVEHLELIVKNGINNKTNSNLSKLFSISYIKIYLKYLVTYLKEKKKKSGDVDNIIKFITNISDNYNNNFRKVLKIYILKLFYSLMDNNMEQFKNFKYEECNINFHKEFSLWKEDKKSKKTDILNYCFINLDNEDDKKNYFDFLNIFENCRINNFSMDENAFAKKINEYGIDTFLCIAMNKIICNLGYNEENSDINNFYNYTNKIFNGNYECNQYLKNLLFLFFNKKNFDEKIKNKLIKNDIINSKLFEMILYSFRFCVQSLDALDIQKKNNTKKKLLFSSIIDPKCYENITSNYFPGDEIQDLHLITLKYIEAHLNVNIDKIGCYVCSCGYYYSIQPCGFPTVGYTSVCPICKLDIGYGEKKINKGMHSLVRRPGHYRIFKDEKQHKECMKRYKDSDVNIPNMTLEEYKREVIGPILKKGSKGINPISKDSFLQRNKNVRNLNELSYRILTYLIYSHLFFANCLNYIDDDNLEKKYLIKDMKCIEILEKDWDLIQENLQEKGIQSIQIFMNLIFKRVSELIKNCEFLTEDNLRNTFEDKFVELVNKCLTEYNDYSLKFITENQQLLESKDDNFPVILKELSPPTEDKFPPQDYPLFKYFVLTKYSNISEFKKRLGPPNIYVLKYPLLHQYLLDNVNIKKMKYLPAFNEFTNYMVDNYSFRISRDDAKKRVLKTEPIYNDKVFKNKFNNFIDAWKEIKSEAKKYKCRPDMDPIDLNSEKKLIYFLNDDGELGYGMYIASACQNFITWQNGFLQPIIDNIAQNGILHYFVKNMERKIPVQNAKINQTLLIEDCFNNSIYKNFEDIISTFCRRDIFKDNGEINYFNYNSFVYDFSSIEEELGRLLLPGKCLFENEDNLNFMTFWSEGFRGGKSDTLSTFYLKYPQTDLNDEEKIIIIKYIKKQKKNNFNSFFGSIQLIIYYLINNNHKNDEIIIDTIPKYINISEDCYKFFKNEGKEFKIEKLMNIFFFIEHLCFKELSETLQIEYKKEIKEDLKTQIKEKLLGRENNFVFSVKQLAAAVRRYISRYLVGKREAVDIDENRNLTMDLTRIDLWEEKIGKLDNLEELLFYQIGEFKLNVGQAYEFYKLIESEDINPLDEMNKKKNQKI